MVAYFWVVSIIKELQPCTDAQLNPHNFFRWLQIPHAENFIEHSKTGSHPGKTDQELKKIWTIELLQKNFIIVKQYT